MTRTLQITVTIVLIFAALHTAHSQEFTKVADGVEHAEFFRQTDAGPIRGNLIRLDPRKVRLDVVHAMDAAIGVERTSSIAIRYGAIAAVNAGFFRLDTSIWAGDSAGVMRINGRLISESYGGRAALGLIYRDGEMHAVIDRVNTDLRLKGSNDGVLVLDGVNRERKEGEVVVFTEEFGRSTLTNPNGMEMVVDEKSGVVLRTKSGGSSPIQPGTFIVSFAKNRSAAIEGFLKSQNNQVWISSAINPVNASKSGDFTLADDIVGGVGYIVQNGKTVLDWSVEKTSKGFYETRHPRTAFAKLNDGMLLLVTLDGRQPEHSIGVSLAELAEILKSLGAVEVINLDGGGSTAMFLDGKIVNRPSDKEGERRVGDALLVFPVKGGK